MCTASTILFEGCICLKTTPPPLQTLAFHPHKIHVEKGTRNTLLREDSLVIAMVETELWYLLGKCRGIACPPK